jgi:hypothetical protein
MFYDHSILIISFFGLIKKNQPLRIENLIDFQRKFPLFQADQPVIIVA